MDNKEKKNEQDMINTQVEPHNHRAIIGFDKNGVPKVLVPVSGHTHKHVDENGNEYEHSHEEVFTEDYMKAVAAYRKTFPTKQDVLDNVPDPAVKEMMLRMEQLGYDTAFDRFDKQQPQCSFGLSGTCCRICNMGPCRITPKSPRGVCGADADLIVARNLLRGAAGRCSTAWHACKRTDPDAEMGSSGQTGYSDHRRIQSHCNGKGIWHKNKTQTDQKYRD